VDQIPPNTGAQGQAIGRSRGGPTTKIHALTEGCGRAVALLPTPGNIADISAAPGLLAAMPAPRRLIADRGYDANHLRDALRRQNTEAVIPSTRSRKRPIPYDARRYRERNKVERAICSLRDFRRVATRHDTLARNFLSAIAIAAAIPWST
jgi:transposase